MDISKIDVGAIRGRADVATPGPWKSTDHYPHIVFQGGEDNIVSTSLAGDPLADGAFIAHAREDVPALLAVVETVLRLHAADDAAAAEFAAALDGSALETLLGALNEEHGRRGDSNIVDLVREKIATEYPDTSEGDPVPVAVVFETDEYDNGFFFDYYATVFFSDGSHDEGVDFYAVNDELTDTYGQVAPKAMLGIDLRTGQIAYSESGADVCALLGIKDLETARQSEGPEDNQAPAKTAEAEHPHDHSDVQ